MKKKLLAVLLSTAMVASLFAGCGAKEEAPADTPAATEEETPAAEGGETAEKGTIGFSVYFMEPEFFQDMERGTKQGVEELGYGYAFHDQNNDETQMVSGAKALINQGIQALIISPCKPDALNPIVEEAHAKGIPVIVDDIGGGGSDYDAIVVSDCFGGGEQAAEYALANMPEDASKEVAIIKCEPTAVYAIRRGEGFKAKMEEAGYTVVKELCGNSMQEEGYTCMQDILTANPNISVLFAENDPMAVGAAQACQDAGRDDIMIIGFNNESIAQEAIKDGIMDATIAQYPDEMGYLCAQLADKLIRGEELEYDNPDEREIYADVKLLTAADFE